MMRYLLGLATVALLWASAPARADSTVLSFPNGNSFVHNQTNGDGIVSDGKYGWSQGNYVRDTFTNTGLGSTTSSEWVFSILDYSASDVTNAFALLINGTTVGSFNYQGTNYSDTILNFDITTGPYAAIAGPNYTLEILQTSPTIYPGGGSYVWQAGGQVTLTGGVVPEPGSFLLMGLGVAGLAGYARWRRGPARKRRA
jgi:PEP-CTERM motif